MKQSKNKSKITLKINLSDKFKKIIKDLPYDKFNTILLAVQEEVTNQIKAAEEHLNKEYNFIYEGLDRNITAAMLYETDIKAEEMKKIFELAQELMKEDNQKFKLLEKEGDGDFMKAIEKYYEDLKCSIEKLYSDGVDKKTSIAMLMVDYPKLSKSMITNAYRKVVDLIKEGEELLNQKKILENSDEDVKEAVEYILEDEKEKEEMPPKNLKKEAQKVIEEVSKDLEEKIAAEEDEIKIISKTIKMEVKGKLGVYKIEDNKMSIEGKEYNSLSEIEEEYKRQLEHLERSRAEVIKVYSLIED